VNKLLAVLYLVLSLFGVDLADGADALCRHTLLPGVCEVKPAVRRQLPTVLLHDCARPHDGATATDPHCAPPRPRAAP
jgi:hypothetical protein